MMGLPFCEQRVHCPLKAESSVKLVSKHPNTHDKHNVFEKQHCNTTNTLDQQFNLYTISPPAQSSSIFACGPAVSTNGMLSSVTDPRCLIHSVSTRRKTHIHLRKISNISIKKIPPSRSPKVYKCTLSLMLHEQRSSKSTTIAA